MSRLKLRIISPEKILFVGDVDCVTVPGSSGEFQIYINHSPIISCLDKGKIVYDDTQGRHELQITSGFVEVQNNNVSLCVEL